MIKQILTTILLLIIMFWRVYIKNSPKYYRVLYFQHGKWIRWAER